MGRFGHWFITLNLNSIMKLSQSFWSFFLCGIILTGAITSNTETILCESDQLVNENPTHTDYTWRSNVSNEYVKQVTLGKYACMNHE